ncbi:MAG: hypothetical protein EA361_10815 [Bacteroidetes bacterium]|nr:MAG: hypothetical protein EA361_10815 [Bacteroidota bacterium]
MKKIVIIFILSALLASCSDFQEKFSHEFPQVGDINPISMDFGLAVVNLTMNPQEYNHMYENYWSDIYVYGLMDVYRDNELVFSAANVRFGIKGSGSRKYELKSLGVRFEQPIDNQMQTVLNPVSIMSRHNLDLLYSLRLRNSGNDFSNSFNPTMIKDISYTQLAMDAGLDLDLMYGEQAAVFLNGKFLGVMNIRSESTARGIAGLYQTTPDRISLAKISPDNENDAVIIEIQNGDYQRIRNLLDAIDNRNTLYVRQEIDVNNFIDYIIFNTFIANRDWPHNNVRIFAVGDAPFRFFMFDLDHANISHKKRGPLTFLDRVRSNPVTDLFYLLYEDEAFQNRFYERFSQLLASGLLAPERFREIVIMHYKNIDKVMPFHIEKYRQPAAMAEWYRNVEQLNVHYEIREAMMRKFILEE